MKLLFIISLILVSTALYAEEIYLTPGLSHSIRVRADQSVRIKGKNTISAITQGQQLLITANALGEATVDIDTTQYKIYIVDQKQIGFLKALHLLFADMLGLRAEMRGGLPTVIGELHRIDDWQKISDLAIEMNSLYIMMAQPDSDIRADAIQFINQKLNKNNLPLPHILWRPKPMAIVSEEHKNLSLHWEQTFNPLGLEVKYEKSQLAVEPLVRVRIVVAEVNKKLQSQFGIEWPNMITAQIAPKFKGPTSLEVFLKAMEQNGMGQILASPNLLARSGSEADFLAGGEFAIKVITARTRDVIWKKHGIYLKIKPKADRAGRMSIELSTEVSLIDAAQTIDGIPGLKTNRMSTHFDLASSQTIVLSGLIRNDWGKSENGVQGLAKIPLIGALFSSKEFISSRSELIVFVTPEIVTDQVESEKKLLPKEWVHNE